MLRVCKVIAAVFMFLLMTGCASAENVYTNKGLKLTIPDEYAAEVIVEVPAQDTKGELFTVTEKKSQEAGKKEYPDGGGFGWLFTIAKVDDAKLHDLLCGEMSGVEVFATDNEGNHYIYCHATDVRYVRENNEAMKRDQNDWIKVNDWAREIPEKFIQENNLQEEIYANSDLAINLAQIMYKGKEYTISTNEFGVMESKGVDVQKYAYKLIRDAQYEIAEEEAPDGEYVVLNFPKSNERYDFFFMPGKENYVRKVYMDGQEMLYKIEFADDTIKASEVMHNWYKELVAKNAKG
ncbi:MAG: hypothetical protein K6G55_02015 [Selenomonadaceae bacterium]|nr:hypothetical protein [Selenomonadaceae bacterium]